jgi:hypothetical protein
VVEGNREKARKNEKGKRNRGGTVHTDERLSGLVGVGG